MALIDRQPARPMLRSMLVPGGLLVMIAVLIALPIVVIQLAHPLPPVQRVSDFDDLALPSEWADQALFHRPIIDTMRRQWPAIDIVEYDSATAPGYHALMATLLRVTAGPVSDQLYSIAPVLVLNLCFGLGLLLAVYVFAARAAGAWPAMVLCLPVATSKYILGGTAFLTTDNLAWMFVVIALGLAVFTKARPAALLGAGIAAMFAVSVRQIMVWSAGPAVLAGLLVSPLCGAMLSRAPAFIRGIVSEDEVEIDKPSWRPLIFAGVGAGCAFALLGVFVVLWGGLVPRASEFVRIHAAGPNLATPAFLLALFGVCGVFYLPLIWNPLMVFARRPLRDPAAILAIGSGISSAIAVRTASTIDMPRDTQMWKSRAYGWLWQIAQRTPDVAERSLLIAAAAGAGALGLLLLYRSARSAGQARPALVLLVAMLGFTCAQMMNTMAWQRYFEPLVLIALAWLGAMVWPSVYRDATMVHRRAMLIAPLALGAMLLALSVALLLLPMVRHATG